MKLAILLLLGWTSAALADITVGVSVSMTGPGTSLGVPISNTFPLLPKAIAGETVRYVLLDDASDPTTGAKTVNRFATEDKVDVIIGSSTVPVAIGQGGAANEARIPLLALCPIPLDPAKQPYVFAIPQPVPLMIAA
ncbi:MAG TPA: ABC transporter substrate-binding protein, partial [Burkholderiales bacterium]